MKIEFPQIYNNVYYLDEGIQEEEEAVNVPKNKGQIKNENLSPDYGNQEDLSQIKGPQTDANEFYLWVSEAERNYCARINNYLASRITNWGNVFMNSLHVMMALVWIACFLRPDFFNVNIIFPDKITVFDS